MPHATAPFLDSTFRSVLASAPQAIQVTVRAEASLALREDQRILFRGPVKTSLAILIILVHKPGVSSGRVRDPIGEWISCTKTLHGLDDLDDEDPYGADIRR
jgi:hypothetical protein